MIAAPSQVHRHASGVFELEARDLDLLAVQDFIVGLSDTEVCAIFFSGDEKSFSSLLLTLKQKLKRVYFVLKLTRHLDLENFRVLAPRWVIQNLFLCPEPYRLEAMSTLSTGEMFSLIQKLSLAGIEPKILPYRDYAQGNTTSEAQVRWKTRACEARDSVDVSVIIPTRNYGHFVINSLRHLSEQTLAPHRYEVILVDDQSTDSTFEWTKAFVAPLTQSFRFQYISHHNPLRGSEIFCAGLCRNLGLSMARGRIILFLDSDMLIPRDYLSGLIEQMQKCDVLQSPRYHIKPEKSSQWTRIEKLDEKDVYIEEQKYWKPFFDCERWQDLYHFWRYTCTYTLAIQRRALNEVGGFRDVFQSYGFEDTELGYRLAKAQKSFHLWKKPTYHLTPPRVKARYAHSIAMKHVLLSKTAKVFFLSTLDAEVYSLFRPYMGGEGAWRQKVYAVYKKYRSPQNVGTEER